jgi:hypothetical protein
MSERGRAACFFNPLAEANEIAKGIHHAGLQLPPRCGFESRPHIAIALRADLGMKGLNALHHHADAGGRAAVAVMLAQMQEQIAARNLATEQRDRSGGSNRPRSREIPDRIRPPLAMSKMPKMGTTQLKLISITVTSSDKFHIRP